MQTVHFAFERATKNKLRFMEVDEHGHAVTPEHDVIGTLYIRKGAFKGLDQPQTVTVTLTPKE